MDSKEKSSIINDGISLLGKVRCSIPRWPLLLIYRAFQRPHLEYWGAIYDKPCNGKFIDTLESIQYNATLLIGGATKGT